MNGYETTKLRADVGMAQGKQLTYEQRQAIVDVKRYRDAEKRQGKRVSTQNPALRTAQALDLRVSTVKQVLATVHQQGGIKRPDPKPRGHGVPKVGDHEISMVRRLIQEAALRGEMVTLDKLLHWLEARQLEVTYSALRRTLHRAGFVYGQASRRRALTEREEMIANRRRYLATMRTNRDGQGRTRRPEVYLDETFVNVNHRQHLTWNTPGALVNVPAGVGERLIIVDAIIQDEVGQRYGWVAGAHLHCKARRRTGVYHGSMKAENCTNWMAEQLLPNIPRHSLIVFDKAPYHNLLAEGTFPQSHHKKAELQSWLIAHDIAFDEWLLKPALYALCRDHAPARSRPSTSLPGVMTATSYAPLNTIRNGNRLNRFGELAKTSLLTAKRATTPWRIYKHDWDRHLRRSQPRRVDTSSLMSVRKRIAIGKSMHSSTK